jgi:hypothetical protein
MDGGGKDAKAKESILALMEAVVFSFGRTSLLAHGRRRRTRF